MVSRRMVLIGAGNVATHLGLAFFKQNLKIEQVYSRTTLSANTLALKLNAEPITNPEKIIPDADIYIISVSDDAIVEVLKTVSFGKGLVLHTSGAVPANILKSVSPKYGVFYPLQTFSKNREIDFSNIPVLIEASYSLVEKELLELGKLISSDVRICDSDNRKFIHLAAVFVNNFTNFMYLLGEEILHSQHLPFDLLYPLILETAEKVKYQHPQLSQTGPAIRNDQSVILAHLELLATDPEKQEIYKLLTKRISNLAK